MDHVPQLTYPFRALTPPPLCFAPPTTTTVVLVASSSVQCIPRKRARPLADIDGLDYIIRDYAKKRRLRLKLITSRLSEPFAVPATNILDRSAPHVAFWAKARSVSRSALRKAAILNRIKRDAMAVREAKQRRTEAASKVFREKLAAAANASFQRSDLTRRPPRRRPPTPIPPKVGTGDDRDADGSEKSDGGGLMPPPDPYDSLPSHRRPPSPPSEFELNRRRLNMNLHVNCC